MYVLKKLSSLSQNTSEYANDTSKAAKDRDRTQPSTVERYYVILDECRAGFKCSAEC